MFLQVHTRLLDISVDTQHLNNHRTATLSPSIFTRYICSEDLIFLTLEVFSPVIMVVKTSILQHLNILATYTATHITCPQCMQFKHLNTIASQ